MFPQKRPCIGDRPLAGVGCPGVAISASIIEPRAVELVLRRLEMWPEAPLTASETWRGQVDLDDALRARESLFREIEEGKPAARRLEVIDKLERRIDELQAERRASERKAARLIANVAGLREQWDTLDQDKRRAVLGDVIATLIVKPLGKGKGKRATADSLARVQVAWREA